MRSNWIVPLLAGVILILLLIGPASAAPGPLALVAHDHSPDVLADNSNPPASPVKLIFIHHSTGGNWLADPNEDQPYGGLGWALMENNYFVSATNYGWGPDGIGDRTDIPNWPEWFTGPNSSTYLHTLFNEFGKNVYDPSDWRYFGDYSRMADPDPTRENEIIMFKSCFPNSDLYGNPNDPPYAEPNDWEYSMSNAKAVYNNILTYFQTRQDKLFVVITAPPLMESATAPERAANARAFNNWLVNDWLDTCPYDNVAVFDYYNVLTSNGSATRVDDPATNEEPNDAGWPDGNHHRWWNGVVQHRQDINNNYSAYPSGDSHPTTAGHQKATAEFVQLLNVFYNRWAGEAETPTPTATGPPTTATPTATATATDTRPPSTSTATATPTGTPPSGQQTMTFQDGVSPDASYAGTTDATITTWGSNSYANLGGLEYLQVGETGDADQFRLLVRFELSAWLLADIHVDEAWLELRAYDGGYDDDPQDVVAHRITQEWVEGDGWDLFADGRDEGVTWTTARPGVNWATPGGDFDLAELDRVTVAANPDGWYRWNVTSAVQAWVDGTASNYGLLLEPDNAPWAHHEFRASEYSIPNLRPRLVVNYTVGGVATATPTSTSTPSPTSTPGEPPIRWIYLPLILKGWAAPTPTPTPTSTTVVPPGLIRPSDLVYQGAFAYPSGGEWAYSGHALAYYPEGDPTGPADGYPGSLYAAGHAWYDLVGEITIPAPVIADDFDDLPKASVLQSLTDITGGWKDNCTYTDDCIYREVDGLEYLPNINKIAWNLRDWYNVTGYDQDSLGWSELDMIGAQGVWHIGERPSDGNIFHNAKTCDYLFKAPESFASQYLEGKWLVAGNHRAAGAFGGSQGPTLYALAPWEDGNPPESGQNLDALALLYYPEIYPGCLDNPDECYFPNYRPADDWGGGAWMQTADKSGILIFGRKGLGDNCYGTPEECGGDPCVPSKGYHAYPYEPQILFYDPGELREVMAGTREPWEVMPYAVYRPLNEVFDWECAILGAVAYDWERGLMYVTEQEAGPWGETAVHVWRVEG